jgi:hypothetical protein
VSAEGAPARLRAEDVGYDAPGLDFRGGAGPATRHLSTQLIGQYNVMNLLGVLGTLRALGLSLEDAVQACAADNVPGRGALSVPGHPLASSTTPTRRTRSTRRSPASAGSAARRRPVPVRGGGDHDNGVR